MIHHEFNKGLGCIVRCEGIQDVIENGKPFRTRRFTDWTLRTKEEWLGRYFYSWEDFDKKLKQPWKEGLDKIQRMREEIKSVDLPEPKVTRRRNKWSDVEGEIDSDRVMARNESFYRLSKRDTVTGPLHVALLCNIGGLSNKSAESMFWRGAALATITDILENAGYSCDLWTWQRVGRCVNERTLFLTNHIKTAGDSLDVDAIAVATSGWYYRTANHALYHKFGHVAPAYGVSNHELGEYRQFIDTDNSQSYEVDVSFDRRTAVEAIKHIIEAVNAREELV